MLDQREWLLPAPQCAQQFGERLLFGTAQTGGGLVEHDQHRIGGESARTSSTRWRPSDRLPARFVRLSSRPDARKLSASLRRGRALLRAVEPQRAAQEARRGCADRRRASHCRAASCSAAASRAGKCGRSRAGNAPRRQPAMSRAKKPTRPRSAQRAGDQIEHVLFAGAVRADQPEISPARRSKPTSLTATRPPNRRYQPARPSATAAAPAASGGAAARHRGRRAWRLWAAAGAATNGIEAAAGELQERG